MREINLSVTALPARPIHLYYQGENDATVVNVDLTGYVEQFGDGTAQLLHQRPGDAAPYDVGATQQDNILSWVVSAADVQRTGNGRLQLVYTVGETVARSPIVYTHCSGSLGQETDPPGVALTWTEQIEAQMGNLSDLTTADKGSLVAAINEAAQSGGGSGGMSSAASALLITVLRNAVYSSDQSANITALESALAAGSSGDDTGDTGAEMSATYSGGTLTIANFTVTAASFAGNTLTIQEAG